MRAALPPFDGKHALEVHKVRAALPLGNLDAPDCHDCHRDVSATSCGVLGTAGLC